MTSRTIGNVLMNGASTDPLSASVSIFDVGFQRGYGCFEAMRSYEGHVFRLDAHLARLERSADHLRIQLVSRDLLSEWCTEVATGGDGVLRVYVTGGMDASAPGTDNLTAVYLEALPDISTTVRLDLLEAPWHADGRVSELTGAKTLSYGPNLAATIEAKSKGFDDAVLFGSSGMVLEGPTFSIGWVVDGAVCTPGLDSQILASITREATIEAAEEIGLTVSIDRYPIKALLEADEVFLMSTVREVMPVTAVGSVEFLPGPVTVKLHSAFQRLVARDAV